MADPLLGTDAKPRPVQISLTTPSDWIPLDLSGDPMASARRLVDRLTANEPRVDERLKLQLAGGLQTTIRQTKEQGGVLAAFWSRMLDDKTIGASVIAAITPLREPMELEAAFRTVSSQTEAGEGRVLAVDRMELPAGEAIRVRKQQDADAMGSHHQTEVLQYFLLVPEQPRLVVLTFSTPTLEVVDALMELFNTMAASLRWHW